MAGDLVVVAAHGPDFAGQCVASLGDAWTMVVDTGSGSVPGADVIIDGGYPTGAYLWAYRNIVADGYLFVQDCMTASTDPLAWFRDQWPGSGAVAWGRFPMQWDSGEQVEWVESAYPSVAVGHGIFGPVFYTDRQSLDILAAKALLPAVPTNRMQAQGTERAWAYAFAAAGLPVVGPEWDPQAMRVGFGPFRKVWAARP